MWREVIGKIAPPSRQKKDNVKKKTVQNKRQEKTKKEKLARARQLLEFPNTTFICANVYTGLRHFCQLIPFSRWPQKHQLGREPRLPEWLYDNPSSARRDRQCHTTLQEH